MSSKTYMLKKRQLLLCFGLFCWLTGAITPLTAQNTGKFGALEFGHQQRIVFLGGSLFENELANGYLEFALSSRWPDRNLTFRNLGWTGDNVYAEARSTFSNPPTAYQQLFQQIRAAKPNYVFIAYGGVESEKGNEGLEHFMKGLEIIIDSVDALGAQTILLSTIPVKMAGSPENTQLQNQNLELYAGGIARIAGKRNKRYVDFYRPVMEKRDHLFLDNGIHLNQDGYYFLAQLLEKSLGWPTRGEKIVITNSGKSANAQNATILANKGDQVRFGVEEKLLPLPVPSSDKISPEAAVTFQINGLKKGFYTLTENGKQLITASAAEWAKGITPDHGISMAQSEKIRDFIVKKNDLFFQQYRPLNRTYILGFRAYEQGRHKQGLQDLDFIITWLEGQISLHRKPVAKVYEISPVK